MASHTHPSPPPHSVERGAVHEAETPPAMTTAGREEENALTILWRIENISRYQKRFHGDRICTLSVCPLALGSKVIKLILEPLGESVTEKSVNLGIYLDGLPFTVDCELSLVTCDGSSIDTRDQKYLDGPWMTSFEIKDCPSQKLQGSKKLLPHDTLTVRCRVWQSREKLQNAELITARTRIEFTEKSVLWPIQRSWLKNLSQKETFPLELPFIHCNVQMNLVCSLIGESLRNAEFNIEVNADRLHEEYLVKLEVLVSDNKKAILILGEKENSFPFSVTEQTWVPKFELNVKFRDRLFLLAYSMWGKNLSLIFNLTAVCKDYMECIEKSCIEFSNLEEERERSRYKN